MIYVPNIAELEMLKSILADQEVTLGVYRNAVGTDGSLTISSITELTTGGGRGYAPITLSNDLVLTAATADKWFLSTDVNGKASGAYDNAVQTWTFNAVDVADGYSAYGVFAYTWVVPFDAGSKEIKVGDTVKGAAGATGIVTSVLVHSGTWGAGTAAGDLRVKTKTGTFVNDENLYIAGEVATFVAAPTAAGDTYSIGDLFRVVQTGAEGCIGVVLTLTGGDNTPVATIGTVPGAGGRNYTVGAGKATAAITGTGAAMTVEIATLSVAACAVSNTGTTNAGDAHKRLLYIDPFSTAQTITPAGFQIQYPCAITLSSSS